MPYDENKNDMQAVIEAARLGVTPTPVAGVDNLLFVPMDSDARICDLQEYTATPRRKSGVITVFDAGSFNAVMDANKDSGTHTVYIDRSLEAAAIIGVMNDNGETKGWRDHRVRIELRKTPQWQKWLTMDGKMVSQTEFAEFIEDNLDDIAEPEGARMLEIVTYLQATRTVDFKSGVRLSNGQIQFENKENIEAKVGIGQIAVPETFKLAITPYQGQPLYSVPARFRYRLNDGKLTMGLKLQRIENLLEHVLDSVISGISCENVIYGRPSD